MSITIADLTSNIATSTEYEVTGDGVFDDLMEAINTHLDAQFKLGRITGTDFSTVYLGAMQSAIQQAVAFLRTQAEVDLLDQKGITEYAQTQQTTKVAPTADSVLGRQITLYDQQAKGFKWNADQKYLKTLADMWAVNVNTAGIQATQITAINAVGTDNLNTQIANAEPTE